MVRGLLLLVCVTLTCSLPACGGESRRNSTPREAGDEPDGGMRPSDSGMAPSDGGTVPNDSGVEPSDGGMAPSDGGTVPNDSGAPATTSETIDDMGESSDPNGAGFVWTHGIGNWFVTSLESSGDASVALIEPPRGASLRACHVDGADHAGGVDLWAQLDHPSGHPVDLSAYTGFSFWARLSSSSHELRVGVNQVPNVLAGAGETLDDTLAFDVLPDWQLFAVKFEDLGADPASVVSIDFIAGAAGERFDLWVDDLALVCDGACPAQN